MSVRREDQGVEDAIREVWYDPTVQRLGALIKADGAALTALDAGAAALRAIYPTRPLPGQRALCQDFVAAHDAARPLLLEVLGRNTLK